MRSSGPHPPETATGAPEREAEAPGTEAEAPGTGVARKMVCWVCGGDLIFNFVRARSGTLVLDLYCRRCAAPRTMTLHLHAGDDHRLFGNGDNHGRGERGRT